MHWVYLSLVAQIVKSLPAMQETLVQSLGQEDPLQEGMAIHCSILAWRISWIEKSGGLQSMEWQRVRHDWATNTLTEQNVSHVNVFSSVQSLSHVRLFATPWTAAHHASLSITNSQSFLKLLSIESVMPSNHLILCRPLLLLSSIFLSIRIFSKESVLCIRWPKYWSFSFSISPPNEYSELISFRTDWSDLLAVQRTLKSLLQHHSSKAPILQCSAFFIDKLSHPYMTTGKTITFMRWTFVGKVMSLLFNMLSRLVITFLPRSKHLLISWLQSPSAVILEPLKSLSLFPVFPHLFGMKWWDWMPWS